MRDWNMRLHPKAFTILGGEPTLNPRLVEFLEAAANCWRSSRLRLVSNGLLLSRHEKLPSTLTRYGIQLVISLHEDAADYHAKLWPARAIVDQWRKGHPTVEIHWRNSYSRWRIPYRAWNNQLLPFYGDDAKVAHNICREKESVPLFEGRLWRCPEVAYCRLPAVRRRLGKGWESFLAYEGLASHCSDEELEAFCVGGPPTFAGCVPRRSMLRFQPYRKIELTRTNIRGVHIRPNPASGKAIQLRLHVGKSHP